MKIALTLGIRLHRLSSGSMLRCRSRWWKELSLISCSCWPADGFSATSFYSLSNHSWPPVAEKFSGKTVPKCIVTDIWPAKTRVTMSYHSPMISENQFCHSWSMILVIHIQWRTNSFKRDSWWFTSNYGLFISVARREPLHCSRAYHVGVLPVIAKKLTHLYRTSEDGFHMFFTLQSKHHQWKSSATNYWPTIFI